MLKIFADGATLETMRGMDGIVDGYTFNPSLCRKIGVKNYLKFCIEASKATTKPVSLEVIADDFNEMERQARILAAIGKNVYVKIPISDTRGESSVPLITKLCAAKIKVNVTAVFTAKQIKSVAGKLIGAPAIISIFAGRIADTGISPMPLFGLARELMRTNVETLWASTRELYNLKQAKQCGADIITMSPEMIQKMGMFGYSLEQYSIDTIKQFYTDAAVSGYKL